MDSGPSGEQTQFAPRPSERWSEDLVWQAKRGLELGRDLCTCEGLYHALRGILRAADFIREDQTEEAALASVLAPHLCDGPRVLICGAADPATLCAVGRMADSCRPDITIIDKCQAPLRLIEEFAAMRGIRCQTRHADLLGLDGAAKWNVILVHYTASFIEPGARKRFFESLALSLAPGGTLVCVAETSKRNASENRAGLESAWIAQARNILDASPLASHWLSAEREQLLRIYGAARTRRRLNVVTPSEIEALMGAAGLSVANEKPLARPSALRDRPATGTDVKSCVVISAAHSHD